MTTSISSLDKPSVKTVYLPIILLVIYLVCTLLLYVFGPFAWVTYNSGLFYALQIAYVIFLFLGYYTSTVTSRKRIREWSGQEEK